MAKREYELRGWITGASFGNGKQGHTSHARRESDAENEWRYVLKRLKFQKDATARRRMHIEVATMETLDHPGIVKLIESNAREFASDAELYLVTERVNGPDLESVVAQTGTLQCRDAAEIVLSLLDTLEFVHSAGVIHRDIKPCHIILKDRQRQYPVLIDFGFSFNEDVDSDGATESNVIVGNRFIGMPEQQVGSSEKRDSRSDVTQCVGILLFLLTGKCPGFINDANGRKPHERFDLSKSLSAPSTGEFETLRRIFDFGFEYDVRRRWQSATSLKEELRSLFDPVGGFLSYESRLTELHGRLSKSSIWSDQERFTELDLDLKQKCSEIGRMANKQFYPQVTVQTSASRGLTREPRSYPLILGFAISVASQINCTFRDLAMFCRESCDRIPESADFSSGALCAWKRRKCFV